MYGSSVSDAEIREASAGLATTGVCGGASAASLAGGEGLCKRGWSQMVAQWSVL